ncbi:MAG: hypothetical protein ACK5DV_06260, partial [Planctomycetota bacterium]
TGSGDQDFTNVLPIKDSSLSGSKLLRKELGTIDFILAYVKEYNVKHVPQDSEKRDNRSWAMIWQKAQGQPMVSAKLEGEQFARPIPLGLWGLATAQ